MAGFSGSGSLTGCREGVRQGCSHLRAGLGQDSFPEGRRIPTQRVASRIQFLAHYQTVVLYSLMAVRQRPPLVLCHMGSYSMVTCFLPSERAGEGEQGRSGSPFVT